MYVLILSLLLCDATLLDLFNSLKYSNSFYNVKSAGGVKEKALWP